MNTYTILRIFDIIYCIVHVHIKKKTSINSTNSDQINKCFVSKT